MQELTRKLKESLIDSLTRNQQNLNEPYLNKHGKLWTRKELSEEIRNETDFGIELMSNMLMLSIDIISRNVNN